jgi:glycosyltransferase involved in cell wall biosynthesis
VKLAYLTAQYPKISHSFIRREIAALEGLGFAVQRYSVRRVDEPLPDPADIREREQTRTLLDSGPFGLLGHAGLLALRRPLRFVGALRSAVRMGWRSDRGLLRHVVYLFEACALVRSMEQQQVQHLHAHFATNATALALLARRLGGPSFSFTAHGIDVLDLAPVISIGRKVHEARFVVAVSQHARAHLMRYSAPADWDKIHVVRCGLEQADLEQAPAPLPQEPHLVCVARFDAEKGHLVLLAAAARVARAGTAFTLELIGDGPLRPALERAVAELRLQQHVVFSGWLSSAAVRARLSSSRILVLSSFTEGIPVVLMEAFASGRPVIATYVGGIPELVVPGENGWLVPASSVDELALALQAALAAPTEELQRMGARGRARVRARHSVEAEARTLAELFRGAGTQV